MIIVITGCGSKGFRTHVVWCATLYKQENSLVRSVVRSSLEFESFSAQCHCCLKNHSNWRRMSPLKAIFLKVVLLQKVDNLVHWKLTKFHYRMPANKRNRVTFPDGENLITGGSSSSLQSNRLFTPYFSRAVKRHWFRSQEEHHNTNAICRCHINYISPPFRVTLPILNPVAIQTSEKWARRTNKHRQDLRRPNWRSGTEARRIL